MKKLVIYRPWIPVIPLIISSIYPSILAAQPQERMMSADLEPRVKSSVAETVTVRRPTPLPDEPLLFEVPKDLPPSGTLQDQDMPVAPDATRSVEGSQRSITTIPMPSEPRP